MTRTALRQPPQLLSVVVPLYGEEAGVEGFFHELNTVLAGLKLPAEVIFVDDGSVDLTLVKLKELARTQAHVRIVSLSRNYGHQIALLAGLDRAKGQVVITMDGDLQHPPQELPRMIERWREGYDIVNLYRRSLEHEAPLKRWLTKIFYWFFNRISNVSLHPYSSDFRLIDRRVRDAVCAYRQRHFFLRGIVSDIGFPTISLEYDCPARRLGKSAYTLAKLLDLAFRGIFSYSSFGLKLPIYLGAVLMVVAFANLGYGILKRLRGVPMPEGWLSLFSLETLFFSMIFIFLGVQGVYLLRLSEEVRQQPLYCVKEESHP